jgi:hypothetical protein
MQYIEELLCGNCFKSEDKFFIISSDFKKDSSRLSINLDSGFPRWFSADTIVEKIQIYTLDESNNILPIKETKKDEIQK